MSGPLELDPLGLDNAILRNLLTQTTRAYERQMAELYAEKELAQVTLASIGDGVLATDGEGRIKYLNSVAEKLTGWERAEALGKPLPEIFHLSESEQRIDDVLSHCLEEGRSFRLADRVSLERRDGRRYGIESTCSPIRALDGRIIGAVLVFQDVSDKRLMALQLAHQATHDELTGLLNRQAFDGHLQRALEEARSLSNTHALCYMDLDQFKLVNDTCGHLAGDELLCRVTALLQDSMRDTDLVARLGGDEFGVLLTRCSLEGAERQVTEFHRALQQFRFTWRDKTFAIGASIGLVPITREFRTVAHLLSAADHACYAAKEKGRNRIQVYQEDDDTFVRRHGEMNWVVRIQQTLEQDRFRLFSQQIQPLSPHAAPGLYFEVLLRMLEDDGRVHLPSDFIRAAERYGLMRSIDRWVIRSCIQTLMSQPPPFLDLLQLCSINLSAVSLGDDELLAFVEEELDASGAPPGKLCFEITETAAIESLPQAQRLMERLAARGVRFALDDFGTGMSSYGYLKDLPVSFLKIDGKFIKDVVTDPLDRAMVESINQVGHVMGVRTIAEGVTSSAVVERLRLLGVDFAQGNWISPPRPLASAAMPGRR
ncbi:MAG TPA: EAL domain-containing protein [Thermoanaerobaculia bacterium]|jgi:diguanylate cyclase (GGDEF)-like protein/PAS domain S-box-containing protein|nr:EAL domain-containing protein [Thermoanaerobaculia bacterium]